MTRRPAKLGAFVLAAALVLPAAPGTAYRFYRTQGYEVPPAAYAARWDAAAFPLEFRVLENTLRPGGWAARTVERATQESLDAWNEVATAAVRLELAAESLASDRTGVHGVNEIGFSETLAGFGRAGSTRIFGDWDGNIRECDIALAPEGWEGSRVEVRAWYRYVVMHELGHCLGLHHTEPYPLSYWQAGVPDNFDPPPLMAHSGVAEPELAPDDRVGISLLYPAAFAGRAVGAVAGRVVSRSGRPSRFAYVQALRPGAAASPGPGAFTDENGEFLLEGLVPGPVLLWVHPLLINEGDPHPRLRAQSPVPAIGLRGIQDQWRWATVAAEETLVIPDIVVVSGREADEP